MFRLVIAAIALVSVFSVNVQASTVLSDGEFTGWTSTQIFGTGSQTITRQTSGGNPGAYLEVQTDDALSVINNHFNPSLVYDPSGGAIDTIDYSIDYLNDFAFGQGMGVVFLAEQDGVVYETQTFHLTGNIAGGPWRQFQQTGLTASDFDSQGAPTDMLDFSVAGAVITFGFQTFNQAGTGITVRYDNYSATINPVPIPAALPLLLSALGVFGFMGWRRKQVAARV